MWESESGLYAARRNMRRMEHTFSFRGYSTRTLLVSTMDVTGFKSCVRSDKKDEPIARDKAGLYTTSFIDAAVG
jgi:hypothetical protein